MKNKKIISNKVEITRNLLEFIFGVYLGYIFIFKHSIVRADIVLTFLGVYFLLIGIFAIIRIYSNWRVRGLIEKEEELLTIERLIDILSKSSKSSNSKP